MAGGGRPRREHPHGKNVVLGEKEDKDLVIIINDWEEKEKEEEDVVYSPYISTTLIQMNALNSSSTCTMRWNFFTSSRRRRRRRKRRLRNKRSEEEEEEEEKEEEEEAEEEEEEAEEEEDEEEAFPLPMNIPCALFFFAYEYPPSSASPRLRASPAPRVLLKGPRSSREAFQNTIIKYFSLSTSRVIRFECSNVTIPPVLPLRKLPQLETVGVRQNAMRNGPEEQYQASPRPDEVNCKVHETLAFQEWI
ncbi:hypothetical protein G5I_02105 [Acromyrmex echinatior]|uniref:Uncharacterized protein n=1 Tax=Acromyrmex echinatior TaxID=103372 RepID=F4W9F3_ACREC|nr:hypothetical protein G5I_02105 [Acromyrmex echinatior]